jgi:O-acetylhomoserine (thiol)-lyase
MGPERRASMGIADSLERVSVGIEDEADLLTDFTQALDAAAVA